MATIPVPTFEDMTCRTCGATMRGSPSYAFCDDCGGSYIAGQGWTEGSTYHGIEGLWRSEQLYKRQLSRPSGGSNNNKRRRKPVKNKDFAVGLEPFR